MQYSLSAVTPHPGALRLFCCRLAATRQKEKTTVEMRKQLRTNLIASDCSHDAFARLSTSETFVLTYAAAACSEEMI
jgi:hypothetical protein